MSDISTSNDQTVSLGDWILTMFLSGIPIVGIIMIFVWAFGGGAKASKQNYARAVLIFALISIVIGIISSILFGAIFAAFFTSMSDSMYSTY